MLHLFWNSIYYAMDSTQTWPSKRSGLLVVDGIELSTSPKPPCVPARAISYASSVNRFILLITEGCVAEAVPPPILSTALSANLCILLITEGCVAAQKRRTDMAATTVIVKESNLLLRPVVTTHQDRAGGGDQCK